MSQRTMPSTSAAESPASASAASDASVARLSSLRPESREKSVAPIPAMAHRSRWVIQVVPAQSLSEGVGAAEDDGEDDADGGDDGHDQRDRGDERVRAVGVVVEQDRAHHLGRRRPHEQRGGELVGEQHEHQRRRRRRCVDRSSGRTIVRFVRSDAGAAGAGRLQVRVAQRHHAGELHAGGERQHQRDVHEDDHPARAVEEERLLGVGQQEADAEHDGGDAERHRDEEVDDRAHDPVLASLAAGARRRRSPTGRAMSDGGQRRR